MLTRMREVYDETAGIIFDTTVIRAARDGMMRLMGDANWWMPKWLGVMLRIPPNSEPREEVPEAAPVPVV